MTKAELEILVGINIKIEGGAQVRDIFVLFCYTGLAYVAIKQLSRSELLKDVDEKERLMTQQQKKESLTRLSMLCKALEIVQKYNMYPECVKLDLVLPVLSNHKTNSYLKECADICGITKNLTLPIARHTLATTVTLSNGVNI